MAIVTIDSKSVRTTPDDWRALIKSAIRDPNELIRRLGLPEHLVSGATIGDGLFRTFVPEPFLKRITPGQPDDPLLLQVLPVAGEIRQVDGFTRDAVGDGPAEIAAGLIHKYHGRVLLITRGVCAIHCRYCFRRHYPYDSAPLSIQQFDQALDVVRSDPSIEEVILSGGDPLMMVDERLRELVRLIESIQHVQRLRIHTRLPIVIPQRVTTELLDILGETRLTRIVVVHINHPREIDGDVRAAIQRLLSSGCSLLNQSVLLRGVNDDPGTLVELSKQLVDMNCLPYYLHQLDKVAGAAHFEVEQAIGEELVQQMQMLLPGYAVPRYVRELAGEASKTRIM